jgi:hypothetical protein
MGHVEPVGRASETAQLGDRAKYPHAQKYIHGDLSRFENAVCATYVMISGRQENTILE